MPLKFSKGQKVEGQYGKGSKWYPGVISSANSDGTFDVTYEDGDFEAGVQEGLIRSIESAVDDASAASAPAPYPALQPAHHCPRTQLPPCGWARTMAALMLGLGPAQVRAPSVEPKDVFTVLVAAVPL